MTKANIKPLLDLIGSLESGGNYNAVYGDAGADDDLSQYTIDQIQDKQYRHGKRKGSSAFGRYQFLRKTLRHLCDQEGIPGSARFTPEMQDLLAEVLLAGRGLHRWEAGKLTDGQFMDNLSKEWASLPYLTGKSYYDGDSIGNHALISRPELEEVLQEVKA